MKDSDSPIHPPQPGNSSDENYPTSLHNSVHELEESPDKHQTPNTHKEKVLNQKNEFKSTAEENRALDVKSVKQINKRFLSINSKRLTRMRDALAGRHRQILDVLPVLIHCNHPMMPGFVSRQTPHNIANFSPSKKDIQAGRTIARSFTHALEPNSVRSIRSIFVMGSTGTIAQSGLSDLDIWLCCEDNINENQREELSLKVKKISAWAAEAKLEMHFFLMSTEAFRNGKLSSLDEESSGSAQKLLLLDEFYRSAIYLCGQTPLWWLVPNTPHTDYEKHCGYLIEKRFIQHDTVIDFGALENIPAQEFIGAGVWQLYKAIESPYKSVLKLLLLEAYVHDYPNIEPLSQTFKSLVYSGEKNINKFDSYVLTYQRIEKYLQSQKNDTRLELARRCFYLKVNKPLSKPFRGREKSWQRRLLEDFVKDWGWTNQYITYIDDQGSWKTQQILEERSILISELTRSYRMLLNFSSQSKIKRSISTEELTVLGRKLNAAFERRPGKIENFNSALNHDLSEERIYLFEHQTSNPQADTRSKIYLSNSTNNNSPQETIQGQTLWSCFNQAIDDTQLINSNLNYFHNKQNKFGHPALSSALKTRSSLVEIITWLYLNGIVSRATQFDLQHVRSCNQKAIDIILKALKKWLNLPTKSVEHENFHQPAQPMKVLFLINTSVNHTVSTIRAKGFQRLSNKIDALSYGQFNENLTYSVDMLIINSWNELSVRNFIGEDCLNNSLQEYLQLSLPGTHQNAPERMVLCIGGDHKVTVTRRCRQWLDDICECFYHKHPPSTRYIFQLDRKLLCLQFNNMQPILKQFTSDDMLIEFLGQEQHRYSPIVLDSQALTDHPLRCVSKHARPKAISVFYRIFDVGMEVFIVDERGSLFHSVYQGRKNHNPLRPIHRFLKTCLQRQALISHNADQNLVHTNISFFQLVPRKIDGRQTLNAEPRSISSGNQALPGFEVKATAWNLETDAHLSESDIHHGNKHWAMAYEFSCENKHFSSDEYGKDIFRAAAEYILTLRQGYGRYPIYISDLDLSLSGQNVQLLQKLQTNHYLRVKNALEFQLNRALRSIEHK